MSMGTREAQRLLHGDVLAELRDLNGSFTALAERYAGQVVNHVLDVETATFDSTGVINRKFGLAAGCIEVDNLAAAHQVTVVASGNASPGPPTAGPGVYIVPGGAHRVVALNSHQVTLYGTAGDSVSFQVFTSAPRPVVT